MNNLKPFVSGLLHWARLDELFGLKEPPVESVSQLPVAHTSSDDLLENKQWIKLVEECVDLFKDLDKNRANFDPPRREVVDHVCHRLQEILERSDVEIIDCDANYGRRRHQAKPSMAHVPPGTVIAETLSPGFAVGRRVLCRARVRLAEGLLSEKEELAEGEVA